MKTILTARRRTAKAVRCSRSWNASSDSFRHGFEGRGEEIGDRVWDVGRAAVNAAGYGISEAGRAFQAGKQEYQKRAEEARSSASASGMPGWARNFFAKKP